MNIDDRTQDEIETDELIANDRKKMDADEEIEKTNLARLEQLCIARNVIMLCEYQVEAVKEALDRSNIIEARFQLDQLLQRVEGFRKEFPNRP